MNLRLYTITFIESLATTAAERGIYFYAASLLGFSDMQNLWLALVFGACYAAGALLSHRCCVRWGERRILLLTVLGQLLVHVAMAIEVTGQTVYVGMALIGLLNGMKWPVMESYVGAGHTPQSALKVVGQYNVSWASAVPLGLAGSGAIIACWPAGLFALPAVVNLVSIILLWPLPAVPVHMADDHPQRPDEPAMFRYSHLLTASRWLMFQSYATLWILAALLPHIMTDLGFAVGLGAALAGLLDAVRCIAFLLLQRWKGWHNRLAPLGVALVALPLGFFMVLLGGSAPLVFAGELIFGLVAGQVYYAALYYALVVKNASVDAGGAHESLIGLGFGVGPLAGMAAQGIAVRVGSSALGMVMGVGPLILLCSAGAIRHGIKIIARDRRSALPEARS
ncbi:MAG: MFS transporter [Phycisphaerae bacterium]